MHTRAVRLERVLQEHFLLVRARAQFVAHAHAPRRRRRRRRRCCRCFYWRRGDRNFGRARARHTRARGMSRSMNFEDRSGKDGGTINFSSSSSSSSHNTKDGGGGGGGRHGRTEGLGVTGVQNQATALQERKTTRIGVIDAGGLSSCRECELHFPQTLERAKRNNRILPGGRSQYYPLMKRPPFPLPMRPDYSSAQLADAGPIRPIIVFQDQMQQDYWLHGMSNRRKGGACHTSMRGRVAAIGIGGVALGFLLLIAYLILQAPHFRRKLGYHSSLVDEDTDSQSNDTKMETETNFVRIEHVFSPEEVLYGYECAGIIIVIVLAIIVNSVLVHGVLRRSRAFLLPWLVYHVVLIVLLLLGFLAILILVEPAIYKLFALIPLAFSVLVVLSWVQVASFYNKLSKKLSKDLASPLLSPSYSSRPNSVMGNASQHGPHFPPLPPPLPLPLASADIGPAGRRASFFNNGPECTSSHEYPVKRLEQSMFSSEENSYQSFSDL